MTDLEAKIGRLLFLDVRGLTSAEAYPHVAEAWRHVARLGPGGAIFFGADAIQAHRFVAEHLRGLVVAADLERGAAQQLAGATEFPCPMALAATGDPDLARRVAAATAREARAVGVNQIYAPVADVNVEPDNPIIATRAFGEDPDGTASFVAAAVRGIESEGVIATAKHFPGHGATRTDSHLELPVDDRPADELRRSNLPPFAAAIRAGARSVMVAHVAYQALSGEPGLPATLCPRISTGLLRGELGFRGLAVTDAFNMKGLVARGEVEAAVLALEAGSDGIVHPMAPAELVEGIARAVRSGRLGAARIDEAYERVIEATRDLPPQGSPSELAGPEARELAALAVSRSLAWLGRGAGRLPLEPRPRSLDLFLVADPDLSGVATAFAETVGRRGADLATFRGAEGGRPGRPGLVAVFSAVRGGKGTAGPAGLGPEALSRLTSGPDRGRAVLFGSPWLHRWFAPETTTLVAWDSSLLAANLAAEALFGERTAPGRCPPSLEGRVGSSA